MGSNVESGEDGGDFVDVSTEDDEELLELLGVGPSRKHVETIGSIPEPNDTQLVAEKPTRGILAISKADIEQSTGAPEADNMRMRKKQEGFRKDARDLGTENVARDGPSSRQGTPRKNRKKQTAQPTDPATQSESDTATLPLPHESGASGPIVVGKTRQGKKPKAPPNADGQSRTHLAAIPTSSQPISLSHSADSGAFDTTSLSRSLPSEHFFAPQPVHMDEFGAMQHIVAPVGDRGGGRKGKAKTKSKGRSAAAETGHNGDLTEAQVAANAGEQSRAKQGRKKGVVSGDESAVWEMPADVSSGSAQEMTWQQKLGSYPNADSPSRSLSNPSKASSNSFSSKSRSTVSHVPSPLNPSVSLSGISAARPKHLRRLSADSVTLPSQAHSHTAPPASQPSHRSGLTTTGAKTHGAGGHHRQGSSGVQLPGPKPPPSAYPFSAFDTLPPFNPAQNVHRAPQTPAKGGLAHVMRGMDLPLKQGAFPRVTSAPVAPGHPLGGSESSHSSRMGEGDVPAGGVGIGTKYAGAMFQDSPNARRLPKPDMEDF